MATSADTIQYIHDQIGLGARLTSRKMFGEYGLYLDGKIVALVCDDQLFLKPTAEGKSFLGKVKEAPPYPGAKHYYLITDELEDPEQLQQAVQVTANALPEAKPKRAARKRAAATPSPKKKAAKGSAKAVKPKRSR